MITKDWLHYVTSLWQRHLYYCSISARHMFGLHSSVRRGYEVFQSIFNSSCMQITALIWEGIHDGVDPQTKGKLVFVSVCKLIFCIFSWQIDRSIDSNTTTNSKDMFHLSRDMSHLELLSGYATLQGQITCTYMYILESYKLIHCRCAPYCRSIYFNLG